MLLVDPSRSYRQVALQTASPGHLVLMLYDGIIRFLDRALAGFSSDDPAEFNGVISANIIKAQEIIRELDRCLDLSAGGGLALELRRLYDYFDRRLMESNLNKSAESIQEISKRVSVLRNAWATMLKGDAAPAPGSRPDSQAHAFAGCPL